MCQEARNDVMTIEAVAVWLGTHCLKCHQNLDWTPAPKLTPYCRSCGAPTPVARMLNGTFDNLYQKHHGGRTPEQDRERFCKTGAHKIFALYRKHRPWLYCPLCGLNLNKV